MLAPSYLSAAIGAVLAVGAIAYTRSRRGDPSAAAV
jgi:hypothetical protein